MSAAKNAALPAHGREPAHRRAGHPRECPGLADVVTMRKLLETLGAETSMDAGGPGAVHRGPPRQQRGAVRARVHHAGVGGGTGAACSRAREWRGWPCPAAAPSACGPSTSTSRAWPSSAPTSAYENGYVEARASRLKGARITTDLVTVTGTENLMMAAALAEGVTVHRERGPRAGGRRPGAAPHRHGRAHRGRGHRAHRDRRGG